MVKKLKEKCFFTAIQDGEIDFVVDQQGLKSVRGEEVKASSSMRRGEEDPIVDPRNPLARPYP